jgi:hypothetical protein
MLPGLCLVATGSINLATKRDFRALHEIVLADANRESPKSAALPFPQRSHWLGQRRHGGGSSS